MNLASRLEGQCKTYGVSIIVGEDTQLGAPDFAFVELDLHCRLPVPQRGDSLRAATRQRTRGDS